MLLIQLVRGTYAQSDKLSTHPPRHPYEETNLYRPLVERAIRLANQVLDPNLGIQLQPQKNLASHPAAIPVYLVRSDTLGLGSNEIANSPGEGCILINADAIRRYTNQLKGYGNASLDLRLDESLALILLHETGHVHYRDDDTRSAGGYISLQIIDQLSSRTQNKELRADFFATSQIHKALTTKVGRSPASVDRFVAGTTLSMVCNDISWNLSSERMLGHFAADALHYRKLYQDRGYTHPNIELRFLIINYKLHSNPAARKLLQDFITWRTHKSNGVLYQNSG